MNTMTGLTQSEADQAVAENAVLIANHGKLLARVRANLARLQVDLEDLRSVESQVDDLPGPISRAVRSKLAPIHNLAGVISRVADAARAVGD